MPPTLNTPRTKTTTSFYNTLCDRVSVSANSTETIDDETSCAFSKPTPQSNVWISPLPDSRPRHQHSPTSLSFREESTVCQRPSKCSQIAQQTRYTATTHFTHTNTSQAARSFASPDSKMPSAPRPASPPSSAHSSPPSSSAPLSASASTTLSHLVSLTSSKASSDATLRKINWAALPLDIFLTPATC